MLKEICHAKFLLTLDKVICLALYFTLSLSQILMTPPPLSTFLEPTPDAVRYRQEVIRRNREFI